MTGQPRQGSAMASERKVVICLLSSEQNQQQVANVGSLRDKVFLPLVLVTLSGSFHMLQRNMPFGSCASLLSPM